MKKLNTYLINNITNIVLILLFLNPLFDLLTSLSINVLKLNFNFIIVFKILQIFIYIYYLIFLSKTRLRKVSIIGILLIGIYFVLYLITIIHYKDLNSVMYELQNLIRVFYFPINLICLYNIYEEHKLNIDCKKLSIILFTYIILLFIPLITKTGFNSYAYSKEGSLGWFNSTNEIGGILSILLPIGMYYLFNIKNILFKIVISLVTIYTFLELGTKVPILSLIIVFGLIMIKYIYQIIIKKQINKLIIIIILFLISVLSAIAIVPKTSFYKNIIIHLDFLNVDSISDFKDPHIIDHFIFSERITFYSKTLDNYNNSSIIEKTMGIGYIENYGTDNINVKTIEMDYYDVFFRQGILGSIIYYIPYLLVLIEIYRKIIKQKKYEDETIYLSLSTVLILLLSLFSGHIITAPSVSIFVVMILIMLNKKIEVNKL